MDATTLIMELLEDKWQNMEDNKEVMNIQREALVSFRALTDLVIETLDDYRECSPFDDIIYGILRRDVLYDDNLRAIKNFIKDCFDELENQASPS